MAATNPTGKFGPNSWARKVIRSNPSGSASSDIEAENLYLREELDRARLALSGAHPAAAMLEALQEADKASDTADSAVAMYAQAMSIRTEILGLVQRLQASLDDFESRLLKLAAPPTEPSEDTADQGQNDSGPLNSPPLTSLPPSSLPPSPIAVNPVPIQTRNQTSTVETIPTVEGTPDIFLAPADLDDVALEEPLPIQSLAASTVEMAVE